MKMGEVKHLIYHHPREDEFSKYQTTELEKRLEEVHKRIKKLELDLQPLKEEAAAIACVLAKREYKATPVQKIKRGATKKKIDKKIEKWLSKLTPQQLKALEAKLIK